MQKEFFLLTLLVLLLSGAILAVMVSKLNTGPENRKFRIWRQVKDLNSWLSGGPYDIKALNEHLKIETSQQIDDIEELIADLGPVNIDSRLILCVIALAFILASMFVLNYSGLGDSSLSMPALLTLFEEISFMPFAIYVLRSVHHFTDQRMGMILSSIICLLSFIFATQSLSLFFIILLKVSIPR